MEHATPVPLPAASGLFGPVSTTGYVTITGIAAVETGGSAVVAVVIREGSVSGTVVVAISLAASGAVTEHVEPVKCNKQMYCQLIGSGVPAGSVHVK
jgi:hypothetical protein